MTGAADPSPVEWRRTWDDDLTAEDYSAWRGGAQIGRVYLVVAASARATYWYWVARTADLPQPSGKAESRRLAMLEVEGAIAGGD